MASLQGQSAAAHQSCGLPSGTISCLPNIGPGGYRIDSGTPAGAFSYHPVTSRLGTHALQAWGVTAPQLQNNNVQCFKIWTPDTEQPNASFYSDRLLLSGATPVVPITPLPPCFSLCWSNQERSAATYVGICFPHPDILITCFKRAMSLETRSVRSLMRSSMRISRRNTPMQARLATWPQWPNCETLSCKNVQTGDRGSEIET